MTSVAICLDLPQDAAQVDSKTRQILSDIRTRIDPGAGLGTSGAPENTRVGELITLGEIVLEVASSLSIDALLSIIKARLGQQRSGKLTVTRADGASISVELQDVTDAQFNDIAERLFKFVGAGA